LTLRGYAAPGALVTLREAGSTIGSVAADSSGYFSTTLSSQASGLRTISAQFKDRNGLTSVAEQKSVSVQAQQNTVVEFFLSPSIARRTAQQLQAGSLVQISGYTAANAVVKLTIEQTGEVLRVMASGSGLYEFLLNTGGLTDGDYTVNVTAELPSISKTSNKSKSVGFSVRTENGPTSPDIVVSPQQLPPPIPQTPEDGAVIDGNSVTITGESVPNAQIIIYENGQRIGSVFADENGKWVFEYQATSSPVTLSFEACINGRCSVLSKNITLSFTGIGACRVVFELEQYRFWNQPVGSVLELDVFLTDGDGVATVLWGDKTAEEVFDHSAVRPVPLKHTYDRIGGYNGQVTFTQGGCAYTRYFSVDVVDVENSDNVNLWLVLFLILLLLPFSYISYEKGKKYTP
jgi:hypothetical protein